MLVENWKQYVQNKKEYYKKIGNIECPAFNNEKVFFTRKGFQHLLYKKGDRRNKSDQGNRLSLISEAEDIIRSSNTFNEYRILNETQFWSIVKIINQKKITVIVCQNKDKSKYFLSVMSKKIPEAQKLPKELS